MSLYAEVTPNLHLILPKESFEKLKLQPGMKLKLLTAEDDILVLKLVRSVSKRANSQIDRTSLLLQQQALKKIWEDPEEDLYEV